jgi:hypothetical protein
MPKQVVNSATLNCSKGSAPSTLVVLPVHMMMVGDQPAANIMDHQALVNIFPFGMCRSLANPMVAAATAAAMGVLTPMPCIPNTSSPWDSGLSSTVLLSNMPALNDTSKCNCTWAGVIEITDAGQATTYIP